MLPGVLEIRQHRPLHRHYHSHNCQFIGIPGTHLIARNRKPPSVPEIAWTWLPGETTPMVMIVP